MKRRTLIRIGCAVTAAVVGGWLAVRAIPIPPELLRPPQPSVEFTDRDGVPLRQVLVGGNRFASFTPLAAIPQNILVATIAAEDKRFRFHYGIDLLAMARAVVGWAKHGHVTSGASTITEQLVKLANPRHRTFDAKFIEALTAVRIEQSWSKDKILEEYLNRLSYGNMRVGIGAAAAFYFEKPLADLSLAESALLAALPRAPARLNPYLHYGRAKARQVLVLGRMRESGTTSRAACERAVAEDVRLRPPHFDFEAPHFVDFILQNAGKLQGGTVRTTLDVTLTRLVEQRIRERIGRLHDEHVSEGAAVVIENSTGNVLALVGSAGYYAPLSGEVNGAWARRSPGSTIKPFTYLLAFENGATPSTIVADLPVEFTTSTGAYSPENYDHRFHGPVRYRIALANSLNVSAVKVLDSIGGPGVLQERLRACGLTTLERPAAHYGLGLTIGNAEVRLLELTNAYACLARLGQYKPWRLLDNAPAPGGTRVFARSPAFLIADILNDNSARSNAFGEYSALRFDFPVACKTGTSTDFRDNWAIGYTPEFTVGVWAGNFDGTPMTHVSGVAGAAPVLHDIFDYLHAHYGTTWYAPPTNIVEHSINPITGKLLAKAPPDALSDKFVDDTLPPVETAADYDSTGRVKLSPEYAAWLESDGLHGQQVDDTGSPCGRLRILRPVAGSKFFLDPDLPESNTLPLATDGSPATIWSSDSLKLRAAGGKTCAILTEGRHTLIATDPVSGRMQKTWITVKAL